MNRKLMAGLAAAGVLAGGGSAAALIAAGAPASAANTPAVASASATQVPAYGPLGSLVAKGTITQAQATAIHNALVKYWQDHGQPPRGQCQDGTPAVLAPGGALATVLGQLVKDGTITQSQASAVTTAFTQWVQAPHGYRNGPGDGRGMMAGYGSGTS
jgi:polyhydroxyalkanoate synthesis regulator phasin